MASLVLNCVSVNSPPAVLARIEAAAPGLLDDVMACACVEVVTPFAVATVSVVGVPSVNPLAIARPELVASTADTACPATLIAVLPAVADA